MNPLSPLAYEALAELDQRQRMYLLDGELCSAAGRALGILYPLDDPREDDPEAEAQLEADFEGALQELEQAGLIFRGSDGGGAFPLSGIYPNGGKTPERAAAVAAALALGPRRPAVAEPVRLARPSALSR